jgi:ubiquinone/menaquinone biosynthesis C-methylase UbiE
MPNEPTMSLKSFVKRVLRRPANMVVASSSNLPYKVKDALRTLVIEEPALAAKFLPYQGGTLGYALEPITEPMTTGHKGLPVPPMNIWQGYGNSIEQFLTGARIHCKTMRDILNQSDFPIEAGYRILDFGCGAGRMIRTFDDVAEQCEIWGVDINAEHIIWCQKNLSPPFHFATTTTFPHLPFEDRYFDFIYCGSVFSHVSDLADAWLLELRRVTRPNARIYITVQDKNTIKLYEENPQRNPVVYNMLKEYEKTTDITEKTFDVLTLRNGPILTMVFYDIDYLRQRWARLFRILSVTPEAYGPQTAVLLER